MNKRMNTILFMIGGTFFNVITTIVSFIVILLLFTKFIAPILPEGDQAWSFVFIFVSSIVLSFLAYRYLIKFLTKKIDFEKYFDPLFAKRTLKKN